MKHAHDIGCLAAACRGETLAGAPSPNPAGMFGELQSRPDREVFSWLGRAVSQAPALAGMVVLVAAEAAGERRWSIGWLMVHPTFRRRGIGMALVATAITFAQARGATVVHAETLEKWPAAAAFWRAAQLAVEAGPTKLPPSGESRKTAEG